MEQYFEAMSIVMDVMKIRTSVMYLKDMAILWWRRWLQADWERGNPNVAMINMWDAFKSKLQKYFNTRDATFQARSSLKTLEP